MKQGLVKCCRDIRRNSGVILAGCFVGLLILQLRSSLVYDDLFGNSLQSHSTTSEQITYPTTAHMTVPETTTHSTKKPRMDLSRDRVVYRIPKLNLYMYKAFLDTRFNKTNIRVFGLERKDEIKEWQFMCQWSRNEGGVEITAQVPAKKYLVDASWPLWTLHHACNFDCHIPDGQSPSKVTLVSTDLQYRVEVPVEKSKPQKSKKLLAACVKPITGSFSVTRMVEWFEMLLLTGIDNIIVYNTDLFGSSRFVIEYYEKMGVLTTVSFPYLFGVLNVVENNETITPQDRYALYQQTYLVAVQDCLYRFKEQYEHLLMIDVDEILVPTKEETVPEMLKRIRKDFVYGAGFIFPTAWHFEEHGVFNESQTPSFLYTQRYLKATSPIDNQPKSVIVTDWAISINFHSLLDVPSQKYSNEEIPWEAYGYIHHFRGSCKDKFESRDCERLLSNVRVDPVLPRYKDRLAKRVKDVLDHLQLT